MKRCPSCEQSLPLGAFGQNRANADGLQSWCRVCRKALRDRNIKKVRAADRTYAAAHREEARRRAGAWRAANLERARERDRAYYQAHKEKWRITTDEQRARKRAKDARYRDRRRRENSDAVRVYMRDYYRANPHRWVAGKRRRREAPGFCTKGQLEARMAYYGHRCWMCGGPFEHVDHVIPLSKGGTNWPSNLRPACAPCNVWKRAKMPSELVRAV